MATFILSLNWTDQGIRSIKDAPKKIDVILFQDGSLQVADDGRGMPVDIHPKEKIPGVELILTNSRWRSARSATCAPAPRAPGRKQNI